MRNIRVCTDAEAPETTVSKIIESARIPNTQQKIIPEEQAQELERRFLNSIPNKEAQKFKLALKKIIESKKRQMKIPNEGGNVFKIQWTNSLTELTVSRGHCHLPWLEKKKNYRIRFTKQHIRYLLEKHLSVGDLDVAIDLPKVTKDQIGRQIKSVGNTKQTRS